MRSANCKAVTPVLVVICALEYKLNPKTIAIIKIDFALLLKLICVCFFFKFYSEIISEILIKSIPF